MKDMEMAGLSIKIPKEIHIQLKILAIHKGTSMQEVIAEILTKSLKKGN
jgi:plasmid stability protein